MIAVGDSGIRMGRGQCCSEGGRLDQISTKFQVLEHVQEAAISVLPPGSRSAPDLKKRVARTALMSDEGDFSAETQETGRGIF